MTKVSLVNLFVGLVFLKTEILYTKVVFGLTSGHFDLHFRKHVQSYIFYFASGETSFIMISMTIMLMINGLDCIGPLTILFNCTIQKE